MIRGAKGLSVVWVAIILAALGCAKDSQPTAPPLPGRTTGEEISFAADIAGPIFASQCALSGCHNAGTVQAGLELTPVVAYGNIVNVAAVEEPGLLRVSPGDPENSYLYRKVRLQGPGNGTERMPFGGQLTPDEIAAIRSWIEQGARNN